MNTFKQKITDVYHYSDHKQMSALKKSFFVFVIVRWLTDDNIEKDVA